MNAWCILWSLGAFAVVLTHYFSKHCFFLARVHWVLMRRRWWSSPFLPLSSRRSWVGPATRACLFRGNMLSLSDSSVWGGHSLGENQVWICVCWPQECVGFISWVFLPSPDPLEVAVTGTSLPVDLKVEPCSTLDFGECAVGSCDTQQIWVCICLCTCVLPCNSHAHHIMHCF